MKKEMSPALKADVSGLESGLDEQEVKERQARYGPNIFFEEDSTRVKDLLRDALKDPMLWFLIVISSIYYALGQFAEGFVLTLAIIPIMAMDVYLQQRTKAILKSIKDQLPSKAWTMRAGKYRELDTVELVPGDLLLVRPGEFIPADGVLLGGNSIQIDESLLSGEAFPLAKAPFVSSESGQGLDSAADQNWCYAGTRVLRGEAEIRVVFTGRETLYGEIIALATQGDPAKTPLQNAISALVKGLLAVAIVICLALLYIRLRQGFAWQDAVMSAATLAVAALPEEFPIVYTFYLAIGVYQMARKRVLVRRSVAIENIGSISYICTDKTGTLTEGNLRLEKLLPASGPPAELLDLASLASPPLSQDPLDRAILTAYEREKGVPLPTVVLRFPFTEGRKVESAVIMRGENVQVACKGAPEKVLAMVKGSEQLRQQWLQSTSELAEQGLKVIACAEQSIPRAQWLGTEPVDAYEFRGLLAFTDPPRRGVKEAIAWCRDHGIRVIMITGDHPQTASSIGRQCGMGLSSSLHVVQAHEILNNGRELTEQLRTIDIISRALPEQKLAFVKALQSRGEKVAVTGDGVNDVPALQAADVGIAMGLHSARTAREVSAIVLLDDTFGSIVDAIAEGRQLFKNLQKSFRYLLFVHLPLVCTAMLVPMAGFPLLYLPIHIVWLELVIHPSAMLAFQDLPSSEGKEGPLRTSRFFDASDWLRILLIGSLLTAFIIFFYVKALNERPDELGHARAMALMLLVLSSAVITATLSKLKSRSALLISLATAASPFIFIQVPFLAKIFQVAPLQSQDIFWVLAAVASIALILVLSERVQMKSRKSLMGG